MNRKQMAGLLVCNFVPMAFGAGVLPLLPVYATQRGAGEATAGTYLALVYLAITVASMAAGWVAVLFHSRKIPLIVAGVVCVPLVWLMGRVSAIWSLTLLTALAWWCGGLGLALISILAGLFAKPDERGKTFGLLTVAGGLGTLTGGLASGYIVDRGGFTTLFSFSAAFIALWPVTAVFLTDAQVMAARDRTQSRHRRRALGRDYSLFIVSNMLSETTGFTLMLVRSLVMDSQAFSAVAISTVAAVGSAVQPPFGMLLGWLSDRIGRKHCLALSRLTSIISLAALSASVRIWHFSVVSVISGISGAAAMAIGQALVADLVPQESLDQGLAFSNASGYAGAIFGFAGAGLLLQQWGVGVTVAIAIVLTGISWLLLVPIRARRPEAERAGELRPFARSPKP